MYLSVIFFVTVFSAADGIKEVYKTINKGMYCPTRNWCKPPSSHIVCANHPPDKIGSRCKNFEYRRLTAAHAKQLLDFVNNLRGQAASNTLVGSNNKIMPRAYGMMKLKWDSEIAALIDYGLRICNTYPTGCLTTERHPLLTLACGFHADKVLSINQAVTSYINLINTFVRTLTQNNLLNTPFFDHNPGHSPLKLLQSQATTFGCGAAIYNLNGRKSTWRCCGINHNTIKGKPIYNTTRPVRDTGFSKNCGCPLFHREVENCLCEEWRPRTTSTIHPYMTTRKKLLTAYGLTQLESSTIQNKPFQCPPKIVMVPVMTIKRDGTLVSNRIDLQDIINKALGARLTKTQNGNNIEGAPLNAVGPRLDYLNYVNNFIPTGPTVYTEIYNYEDRIQTIPPNTDIESPPLNSVGEPRIIDLKYVNNHKPTGPAKYAEIYYYEDTIQTTPANIDIGSRPLNSVGESRLNGLNHVNDDIPTGPVDYTELYNYEDIIQTTPANIDIESRPLNSVGEPRTDHVKNVNNHIPTGAADYTEMYYYEDTIQTTPPNTDLTVLPDIIDAYVF